MFHVSLTFLLYFYVLKLQEIAFIFSFLFQRDFLSGFFFLVLISWEKACVNWSLKENSFSWRDKSTVFPWPLVNVPERKRTSHILCSEILTASSMLELMYHISFKFPSLQLKVLQAWKTEGRSCGTLKRSPCPGVTECWTGACHWAVIERLWLECFHYPVHLPLVFPQQRRS